MTRILVPVDFTKSSLAAFTYAAHFADALRAEVTVIHVINGSFSTADSMFLDTMDASYESANQRLKKFITEHLPKDTSSEKITIKREVRFGVPGFTVADYANDQSFDYVVSGMRDDHSLIEKFLGTTSSIITKLTSCPVFLIHENTKWSNPKKVIFTIDDSTDFDESITAYLKFNETFKAATDFLHIKKDEKEIDSTRDTVIREVFRTKEPDFAFEINNIYGGDVIQSIVDYAIFEKADMLVMVHRKRKLLDSVFNRSMSLKTAEGIHLPIMILEENPPATVNM
ncbi:MAG: universal stress protein [Saprospiraceae bacterium]|jgi:nucleotide-binding universal stress UspA family protein|nr:universal stress protein [Saprospiraceae bacterium]